MLLSGSLFQHFVKEFKKKKTALKSVQYSTVYLRTFAIWKILYNSSELLKLRFMELYKPDEKLLLAIQYFQEYLEIFSVYRVERLSKINTRGIQLSILFTERSCPSRQDSF